MSNAYRILKSGLLIEVYVGKITKEELFDHERQLLTDPKFPSAPQVVVDFTRASLEPSIGESELKQFVDFYSHHRDKVAGARVAIVAGKEFERASLFGRLAEREKVNVIVFNALSTACVWLGVKEPEVRKWIERTHTELLDPPPPKV